MTGRHAYLILAHNEFDVLQHLISALDDERNDIYVHIDGKVKSFPSFFADKSKLVVITERIKTYWGDTSLMKAEYKLLQTACDNGDYAYYHIISGVHFPIKSQNYIHDCFSRFAGKSVLSPMDTSKTEIQYKFGRYHLFSKYQYSAPNCLKKFFNILWRLMLVIQKPLPPRNTSIITDKASQWCSLTQKDTEKILKNRDAVFRLFSRTFCCDEFIIPTALKLCNSTWVNMNLLYLDFGKYSPRILNESDFSNIMESECLFARKVSSENALISLIEKNL